MNMQGLDYLVVFAYFAVTVAAGVLFTRKSATGLRSYFLGENQQKWWMLACSGSATNYSVDGTVWNISMLMVLGMMSWYSTLVWWLPNAVILMAFTAVWIRRTGAMTSADLNTVRFGSDRGAMSARIGFAVLIGAFSVTQLCMSYVVLHKFATIFGFPGHLSAMLIVGSTGLYVLFGGFRGVILTDFIQNVLMVVVSFIIGGICVANYDASSLEASISHESLTPAAKLQALEVLRAEIAAGKDGEARPKQLAVVDAERKKVAAEMQKVSKRPAEPAAGAGQPEKVAAGDWKDLAYRPHPKLGRFRDSNYADWGDFGGAALAWSVVGLIGCFGGAGGRYGEQRYLAARTPRHAAWQAALWQVLSVPRWVVTAGLAFLAYTMFKEQTVEAVRVIGEQVVYSDPDAVFPLFTNSALLGPGIRGLVVAALAAAYMSTFSSEVNAAASIVVHDIWQPLAEGDREDAPRNMPASYAATLLIVAAAMGCGYIFTNHSSLNALWSWMLGGLICCVVVPLALRWYWGRMNGWGFAAGCVVGFVPALIMLSKQFVGPDAWVQKIPDDIFTYSILAMSLVACIAVSLLTSPVEPEHIDGFYRRVRPFGLWGSVRQRALASDEPANEPIRLRYIPINVALGVAATYALYMGTVYAMGRWFAEAGLAFGIFAACAAVLYFTWYRTLPEQ